MLVTIVAAFQGEIAHVDQELATKQELQRKVSGDSVMQEESYHY